MKERESDGYLRACFAAEQTRERLFVYGIMIYSLAICPVHELPWASPASFFNIPMASNGVGFSHYDNQED